jgi:hypothetical protein
MKLMNYQRAFGIPGIENGSGQGNGGFGFQSASIRSIQVIVPHWLNVCLQVFLVCVPKPTSVCARQLETLGLYGRLQITSLPALAINCLDEDLASFDDSSAFRRGFLENDPSVLDTTIQTLLEIQRIYGSFSEISGKGNIASAVCEALCQRQQTSDLSLIPPDSPNRISRLICIDRSVDLVTPMLMGFTYEGKLRNCFTHNIFTTDMWQA